MRVFLWHVHGSYTTALVQGGHEYFLPVEPGRGPDGRGRAETWEWPRNVHEVTREEATALDVDVAILQRPVELTHLAEEWLGRPPGRGVPTIYLEHNAPQGRIDAMDHPAADRPDLHVVHVTHFNDLFWDTGVTPTTVIEHGIIDPGYRYSGEIPTMAAVVNEPVRRSRVAGTDLLPRLREAAPIHLFGMETRRLGGFGNLTQRELHRELPKRRVYLHPFRWTSLGLALLEAMHLGMPVLALATTEAAAAVAPGCGFISGDVRVLQAAARRLVDDHEEAVRLGKEARRHALERYGLGRFLADWERTLMAVAR